MADIVDRLKAYAEINESFGTYTEAECAYDAIHEIEKLRMQIEELKKHNSELGWAVSLNERTRR